MSKNVGGIDRILRIVIGLAALAAGYHFKSWWGLAGLIPLGTALIGWCPLYSIFRFQTKSA